jgi:hypothetical protein
VEIVSFVGAAVVACAGAGVVTKELPTTLVGVDVATSTGAGVVINRAGEGATVPTSTAVGLVVAGAIEIGLAEITIPGCKDGVAVLSHDTEQFEPENIDRIRHA